MITQEPTLVFMISKGWDTVELPRGAEMVTPGDTARNSLTPPLICRCVSVQPEHALKAAS